MKRNDGNKLIALYLFSYDAKSAMALCFMAYVLLYLLIGKVGNIENNNLDFWMAFQMGIACFLIGFGQVFIVPVESISIIRSTIWMLWSCLITIAAMNVFGWFNGLPVWYAVIFCTSVTIGFLAVLLGLLWDSERENRKLNTQLKAYQDKLQ